MSQNPPPNPTPSESLSSLLIIEDGTINRMLRDAQFTAEFPFLARAAEANPPAASSCGKCKSKQRKQSVADYNTIKQNIAGLASDKRARLKQLLHTRQARVIYRTPDNRAVRLTF